MNYKIFLISRRGQGAGVSPRSPEGGQFGKVIVNQLKGYPKSFCVQAFVAHTQLWALAGFPEGGQAAKVSIYEKGCSNENLKLISLAYLSIAPVPPKGDNPEKWL